MANPRELAEQAFAILQNALRDSEARASDLDEQLKRKKAPKNQLEESLEVLTHRLETVEAERVRWQQAASHLEEIAEAERAKVAQLKKKLEIAESGPEKLTKKEINFWRAKAEDIDTETKEYKTRLANLRKELMERDALIERLGEAQQGSSAADAAQPAAANSSPPRVADVSSEIEALRLELEGRERRIGELQVELEEIRDVPSSNGHAEPSIETLTQIENLKRQTASFEHALTEAHTSRAALKGELAQTNAELAEQQRAAREAQANAERARATVSEREHRIVELTAEAEHLRVQLEQREQQLRSEGAERDQRIAALAHDLEYLRDRAEGNANEAAHAIAEREQLREAFRDSQQRLEQVNAELDRLRGTLAALERGEREAAAAARNLEAALSDRDQRLADVDRRLADLDATAAAAQDQVAESDRQLAEIREQLAERDGRLAEGSDHLAERDYELERNRQEARAREVYLAEISAELEHARTAVQASDRELTSLRDTLLASNRDLDQLRTHKHRLEDELSSMLTRVDAAAADAGAKDDELHRLGAEHAELLRQRDQMREQMAGLEVELKEEKDNAENLTELVNERREHITKLQEAVEEVEERYEEAKWRLGKAQYFERLVKRRKGLIVALLATLRTKMKANVALKAGLDGLRTYKAAAEGNQQKLLQRIDALKVEIKEAEEAIEGQQGTTHTKEQLVQSQSHAITLEERLNTQAELIQSLEADLKAARATQKTGDEKNHEIERLHKELELKNQAIGKLQADDDERERRLSKLRGSESETVRLRALSEKDRTSIDALEHEVAQLREALAKATAGGGSPAGGDSRTAPSPDLETRLKERETTVTRLMGTIKEHEATIKKLTESADSWKRKYNFLATDSPDAYKTAAEK